MSNKMKKNQKVKILCLDGDGIGPEIATATRNVLAAVDRRFGLNLELQSAEIGFKSLEVSGSTFPDDVVVAAKAADGILMAPVSTNDYHQRARVALTHQDFCVRSLIYMRTFGRQNLLLAFHQELETTLI